jgi:hypothetical protein
MAEQVSRTAAGVRFTPIYPQSTGQRGWVGQRRRGRRTHTLLLSLSMALAAHGALRSRDPSLPEVVT